MFQVEVFIPTESESKKHPLRGPIRNHHVGEDSSAYHTSLALCCELGPFLTTVWELPTVGFSLSLI